MNIVEKHLGDLKPYENNPRKNENAVPYVMESIKRYGFKNPKEPNVKRHRSRLQERTILVLAKDNSIFDILFNLKLKHAKIKINGLYK